MANRKLKYMKKQFRMRPAGNGWILNVESIGAIPKPLKDLIRQFGGSFEGADDILSKIKEDAQEDGNGEFVFSSFDALISFININYIR